MAKTVFYFRIRDEMSVGYPAALPCLLAQAAG
jgi:hypothetical protein